MWRIKWHTMVKYLSFKYYASLELVLALPKKKLFNSTRATIQALLTSSPRWASCWTFWYVSLSWAISRFNNITQLVNMKHTITIVLITLKMKQTYNDQAFCCTTHRNNITQSWRAAGEIRRIKDNFGIILIISL